MAPAAMACFVAMDDEVGADLAGVVVAEADHLRELVAGVDVEEGEGDLAGEEGLLREAQHDGGVLADGVEHDGPGELGDGLAQDGDALGFKGLEMVEAGCVKFLGLDFRRRGCEGCHRGRVLLRAS